MQSIANNIWKSVDKSPMPQMQHHPRNTIKRQSKNKIKGRRSSINLNKSKPKNNNEIKSKRNFRK